MQCHGTCCPGGMERVPASLLLRLVQSTPRSVAVSSFDVCWLWLTLVIDVDWRIVRVICEPETGKLPGGSAHRERHGPWMGLGPIRAPTPPCASIVSTIICSMAPTSSKRVKDIQTSASSATTCVLIYDGMYRATLSANEANKRYCSDSHCRGCMAQAGRWKRIKKKEYCNGMSAPPGLGRRQAGAILERGGKQAERKARNGGGVRVKLAGHGSCERLERTHTRRPS